MAILLPKAKTAIPRESLPLKPPHQWALFTLCGTGAIALHLALLVLMGLVPWRAFSEGDVAPAERLVIGKLPVPTWIDSQNDLPEELAFEEPSPDQWGESFDSQLVLPLTTTGVTKRPGDSQRYSPSSGSGNPFDTEARIPPSLLADGNEDFGKLLARLQKDGLDIVITFDSTGSMQGEIDQVKDQIERIGSVLFQLIPKTRISICTYRDEGDDYVVKGLPLTDSLAEVALYLKDVQASGGGDGPEAVDQGLEWSIEKNDFRRRARKVILLFGDAPPRASRVVRCQKLVSDFRHSGGVVSTVTCRNTKRMDAFVSIAQIGRGESFLTDDEQQIMSQLIVLVFGSQHRAIVLEAFDLLQPELNQ